MDAIDLFAGAGGFTTGATAAGVRVVYAANHWRAAVDAHAANHPGVTHACQDLHQADWHKLPRHDLLLASPSCQGHSRARGKDKPRHDAARSTAWAVVSCAEVHRSPFVIVENVPEFKKWILFPEWASAMAKLGYAMAPHEVDAADHGVRQHRRRLFLVFSRSVAPLTLRLPRRQHRSIRDAIGWDEGTWRPWASAVRKRPLSEKTLERIVAGRAEHGDRFLVAYYGSTRGGRSLDRPIGTLTTRDRYAVIRGGDMRMLSVREAQEAMSFPDDYLLPSRRADAMMMLGNAVAPTVARDFCAALLRVA